MESAAYEAYGVSGEPAETGVLVVDDRPAFLQAVRELVLATPGLVLVGEAYSPERALELVEQVKPELVLMDVGMPGIGGVGATCHIKAAHPSTIVVLISTTRPQDLSRECEKCPADAVIWKNDLRPSVLAEVLRRFRQGHAATS